MNQKEDNFLIASIEDRIRKADMTQSIQFTHFLDPLQQTKIVSIISKHMNIYGDWNGGYIGAERKIVAILPSYHLQKKPIYPITILEMTWNIRFNQVTHRDILGAVLGLGIVRDCIGDIIIQDKRAYVIVMYDIADFIRINLVNVGRVTVHIKNVSHLEDHDTQLSVKEIHSYVSSMRLDTVLGLGFEISRTKVIPLIRTGLVRVNWENKLKPDAEVKIGDMISVRGKGRIQVKEVGGKSKKGRTSIVIVRFL